MTKKDPEAALDACLSQLNDAGSIEDCLKRNPEQAAELEPLLHVAAQLKALGQEQAPAPVALRSGRQKLLSEAARLRSRSDARRRTNLWANTWSLLRRSAVTAALAGLLLASALGGGTIALAGRSLPGDALYPVKRMTEDVQLVLALDRQTKAQLMARFDERRRAEAVAIAGSQRIAEITFRGQLEARSDGLWVVSGVSVYISGETELEQGIEPGTSVRVLARSMSDGKLWARRVVTEPGQPQPPTPTAPAPTPSPTCSPTATASATATTAPRALPPSRETPGPSATTLPPSLTPTARPPSPTLTASPIPPSPTPEREVKIRFKGKIEAMAPSEWTIGGQVVRINAATRINALDQAPAVGVTAAVEATRMPDGGLLAIEITTERPEPASDQAFEFRGLIESFGDTRWVVGGQTLIVTPDTVIDGSPQKGLLAQVKAIRHGDGSLTAQRIAVSPPTEEVQFEGAIERITAGEWVVDGTLVRLDQQTEVLGEPRIGAHVEIQGLLLADGAVLARRVRVQEPPTATPTEQAPSPAEATPTVGPNAADLLQTKVPASHGTPATDAAATPTPPMVMLPAPDPASIASSDLASSSAGAPLPLRSSTVEQGYPIEFRGLIQEVEERYWIASGRIVLITEDTRVHGSPEIGALAEVKGVRLFGDTVLAISVEVMRPDVYSPVQFEGTLESISEQGWIVGGVTVTISSVTVILGTPALGLVTEVQGVLQPDGSVRADRAIIRGSTSAPQIDISGLVEYIGPSQWIVSGTAVLIDERTFIDDSHASADVGMWAQIRAQRRQQGALLAVRILLSRPD